MADTDPLASELAGIKERARVARDDDSSDGVALWIGAIGASQEDVPTLVAAIEAVLKEADSWAQDIPGAIGPGYNATKACGRRAREIITRELREPDHG